MHDEGFSFLTSEDGGPVSLTAEAGTRVCDKRAKIGALCGVSGSFTRVVNNRVRRRADGSRYLAVLFHGPTGLSGCGAEAESDEFVRVIC
jgi:hypothetical protein